MDKYRTNLILGGNLSPIPTSFPVKRWFATVCGKAYSLGYSPSYRRVKQNLLITAKRATRQYNRDH